MKYVLPALVLAASGVFVAAQEKEVPKDSTRITIPGCVKGRTFIIAAREGHEPTSGDLRPGRRFRLSGQKDMLKDIEKREGALLEITGLVKKSELSGPGGLTLAGGRVRIGGGQPRDPLLAGSSPTGATIDAILDVEGWNNTAESCPR
jgi:hypothetical protein